MTTTGLGLLLLRSCGPTTCSAGHSHPWWQLERQPLHRECCALSVTTTHAPWPFLEQFRCLLCVQGKREKWNQMLCNLITGCTIINDLININVSTCVFILLYGVEWLNTYLYLLVFIHNYIVIIGLMFSHGYVHLPDCNGLMHFTIFIHGNGSWAVMVLKYMHYTLSSTELRCTAHILCLITPVHQVMLEAVFEHVYCETQKM